MKTMNKLRFATILVCVFFMGLAAFANTSLEDLSAYSRWNGFLSKNNINKSIR